jgi:hypothetical protein
MFWNKRILSPADGIAIDVTNLEAARQWYKEKFGLSYSISCAEAEEGSIVLGYLPSTDSFCEKVRSRA